VKGKDREKIIFLLTGKTAFTYPMPFERTSQTKEVKECISQELSHKGTNVTYRKSHERS
jgi:hypothetical protein